MIRKHGRFLTRLITFFLSFFIVFSSSSCSGGFIGQGSTINPNGDVLTEDVLVEFISSEIYLKELVVTESKITENLIQDDQIEEVVTCSTIFVPQNHIDEFSKNSYTKELFKDTDIKPLLTKIAVGTGVILTLVVLKIAHCEGLFGSIVASAAPAALKGAAIGAGAGTIIGGLTGAADEIDETGRTSAIIGFAAAVAGFVTATVSVIAAIYSGGASTGGAVFGVKLFLAGVSLISTAVAGYNAIQKCTTSDEPNINWNNINWNKVGESAVRESIEGAANGYMWGSIIGAIAGGAKGYDEYQKFTAPNSSYSQRLRQTPKDGNNGHWTGKRGESDFVLDKPLELSDGISVSKVTYKNGIPDFSQYAEAQVDISGMTNNRSSNFAQADEILAKLWTETKYMGKTWTARDISSYRSSNGLTWHELNNLKTMQLVPTEVNGSFGHLGGVGEYNCMIGQGGNYFD